MGAPFVVEPPKPVISKHNVLPANLANIIQAVARGLKVNDAYSGYHRWSLFSRSLPCLSQTQIQLLSMADL